MPMTDAEKLAERKAFAEYRRLEDQVEEAIRTRPRGMTRSEINHHPLLRSVDHQDVDRMLNCLTDFGTLKVWWAKKLGGQPYEVFRHHTSPHR